MVELLPERDFLPATLPPFSECSNSNEPRQHGDGAIRLPRFRDVRACREWRNSGADRGNVGSGRDNWSRIDGTRAALVNRGTRERVGVGVMCSNYST